MSKKLYVGNLSYETTQDHLVELFQGVTVQGKAGVAGLLGVLESAPEPDYDTEVDDSVVARRIESEQGTEQGLTSSSGNRDRAVPIRKEGHMDRRTFLAAAAALAYPKQERLLSPSEAKDFFANSITSKIKPQFLYVPR